MGNSQINNWKYGTIGLIALIAAGFSVPQAFAARNDPLGDAADPNFDIKHFGIASGGNPYVAVVGKAGGTVPSASDKIYAYVFFTDDGIYAATSHIPEDSSEVGDDINWHVHKVTLSGEIVEGKTCVSSITEDGNAVVKNKRLIVTGTDATEVLEVHAVELTITGAGVCASAVFDIAVA